MQKGLIVLQMGIMPGLSCEWSSVTSPCAPQASLRDVFAALGLARTFCTDAGVNLDAIPAATKLARLKLIAEAVEVLIAPDERRREFMRRVGAASRAYKALLPDDRAAPYFKQVATLDVLAEAVRGKLGPADISAIYARIEALLDEKIEGVAITAPIVEGDAVGERVDLSDIDFEKLAGLFQQKPKTANEQLRHKAEKKARDMAEENSTRAGLVDKLEALVAEYNSGTIDAERFFEELKRFIKEMEEEERRAAREGLTERELAVFDLLTRPAPKLTKAQEIEVKKLAKELLQKLQEQRVFPRWGAQPRDPGCRPSRDQGQAQRAAGRPVYRGTVEGKGRGRVAVRLPSHGHRSGGWST